MAERIKYALFYAFAYIAKILYLLYLSSIIPRTKFINTEYHPKNLSEKQNCIYVFWHSKTFMIMPLYRHSNIAVLTLLDWKNYFYDKLCRLFGHRTVPVTSDADAARKLKKLLDEGMRVALALDGPRGPRGVIRPGAVYLALKTKRPIITVDIKVSKSIRFNNRWDKYEIPLPFSETILTTSKPIYAEGKSADQLKDEIRANLVHI